MQRIQTDVWERSKACVDCGDPIPAGIHSARCEFCSDVEIIRVVDELTRLNR